MILINTFCVVWGKHYYYILLLLVLMVLQANKAYSQNIGVSNSKGTSLSPKFSLPIKNYALFFGVKDYQDSLVKNLRNPIKDTEAIASELARNYNFDTLIYRNPSYAGIEEELKKWQNLNFPKDTVTQLIVFFSGHGDFLEYKQRGYFLPSDAKYKNGQSYHSLWDLRDIITQISCNRILLIVDACYSGTLDTEINYNERLKESINPESTSNNSKGLSNGDVRKSIKRKREKEKRKSRLFITSGRKELTPDGINHSPLTEKFIQALKEGPIEGILNYHGLLGYLKNAEPKPHNGKFPGHSIEDSFDFINYDSMSSLSYKRLGTQIEKWKVPKKRPFNWKKTSSWVLSGLGLGKIIWGGIKFSQAKSFHDDYEANLKESDFLAFRPEFSSRQQAYLTAEKKRKNAQTLINCGIGVAAVGTAIFLIERKKKKSLKKSMTLMPIINNGEVGIAYKFKKN